MSYICTEDTLLGHPFISLYVRLYVWMCGWVLRCVVLNGEYMLTYSSVNRKWLFPHRVWRFGQNSKIDGENMQNLDTILYAYVTHLYSTSQENVKGWLITGRKKEKKRELCVFFCCTWIVTHTQKHTQSNVLPGPGSSSLLNAAQEIQVINKSLSSCLEHWPEGKGGGDGL